MFKMHLGGKTASFSDHVAFRKKLKRRLENAAERFNTLLFDLRECEKKIEKKRALASSNWKDVHRPQIRKRIDSTLETLKATKREIASLEKEIEHKIKKKAAITESLLGLKQRLRAGDSFQVGCELTALIEEVEELSAGRQKLQDVVRVLEGELDRYKTDFHLNPLKYQYRGGSGGIYFAANDLILERVHGGFEVEISSRKVSKGVKKSVEAGDKSKNRDRFPTISVKAGGVGPMGRTTTNASLQLGQKHPVSKSTLHENATF